MAVVDDVLRLAADQIGTTERPRGTNRTRYGEWYGVDGVSWCDIFISWLFGQFPGGLDAIEGKHTYTPEHAGAFRKAGRWGSEPRRGAVVFFDFPDNVDRIQHVGIVEEVGNGTLTTIEGNTSPGDAGSQSNGDGVYRRTRPFRFVAGYGYPDYQLMEDSVPLNKDDKDWIVGAVDEVVNKRLDRERNEPRPWASASVGKWAQEAKGWGPISDAYVRDYTWLRAEQARETADTNAARLTALEQSVAELKALLIEAIKPPAAPAG